MCVFFLNRDDFSNGNWFCGSFRISTSTTATTFNQACVYLYLFISVGFLLQAQPFFYWTEHIHTFTQQTGFIGFRTETNNCVELKLKLKLRFSFQFVYIFCSFLYWVISRVPTTIWEMFIKDEVLLKWDSSKVKLQNDLRSNESVYVHGKYSLFKALFVSRGARNIVKIHCFTRSTAFVQLF